MESRTWTFDAGGEGLERLEALGRAMALPTAAPFAVGLQGPMGAGKTTLARAWIEAMAPAAQVQSPTWLRLVRYAEGPPPVSHADLYGLWDEEELDSIGLWDDLTTRVVLVEWCDRFASVMEALDVRVVLDVDRDTDRRTMAVEAHSPAGVRWLHTLGAGLARSLQPEAP
jgi:tRNA threonylcarbamoyladenosine biosynthesis protein TsaE